MLERMGKLGAFVTERRKAEGLTQEQAASAWRLTRGELSMIERGHRTRLQPDTLLRLARGLGISIEELLTAANGDMPTEAA